MLSILKILSVGLVSAAATVWFAVGALPSRLQVAQPEAEADSIQQQNNLHAQEFKTTLGEMHIAVAEVALELQQMQHRITAIETNVERTGMQNAETNNTAVLEVVNTEMGEPSEADRRRASLAAIESRRDQIRVAFEAQDRDSDWAGVTESNALDSVNRQPMLSGSNIIEMDCRSSICLLRAQHKDDDAAERFRMIFPGVVAKHASSVSWDNNGLNSIAYIQK